MNEFLKFLHLLWLIVKFILDVTSWTICIILGLLGCVLPWRAITFYNMMFRDDDFERVLCIGHFARTVFEVICLCVCLPSLAIPSRAVGFVFTLSKFNDKFVANEFPEYACIWFGSPFIGIAEVVSYTLGLVGLLSVVRTYQTISDASKTTESKNWDDATGFNSELMMALLQNGVTVLLDIFFLPMLVALGLTVWRFPPVWKELRSGFNWVTRLVIFKQFLWLLLDLVFVAPAWIIVTLTMYRLPALLRRLMPVRAADESTAETRLVAPPRFNTGDEQTRRVEQELESICKITDMQRRPISTARLIFLDLLCSPMILLLLFTGYRFRPITAGLEDIAFHEAVCEQFMELVVDLPFLFAGLCLVLSVYRADLALSLVRPSAATKWERRKTAGKHFLHLLGDVASLVPFVVVLCTLYRLFPLFLNLKVRMSRLLYEDPEMRLQEWECSIPRPRGRPRFVIRARKDANLSDVTSMWLQVAGSGFWSGVAATKGGFVASAGQAMLPYALKSGKEIDLQRFQRGQTEVELVIELNAEVKQSAALKFLQALPPETELLLQLEGTIRGGEGTRKAVLLAIPCVIRDLVSAVASEEFCFRATAEEDATAAAEQLATLRGSPGDRRDAWLPTVMAEFVQVFIDLVHLLIAAVLVPIPWRFVAVVRRFLEPPALREAKRAFRVFIALEGWDRVCNDIIAKVERLANRYAKAAAEDACTPTCNSASDPAQYLSRRNEDGLESGVENCIGCCCCVFCPCCPNYSDYDFDEDWEVVVHHRSWRYMQRHGQVVAEFEKQLRNLCAPLGYYRMNLRLARKKWPEGDEWRPLADAVDMHIRRYSEGFYWTLLLHETHVLLTRGSIAEEEHARVTQAIRTRALPLKRDGPRALEELQQSFKAHLREAASTGRYRCKGKSKALLFTALREQLLRTFTDIFAIPIVLLLVITMYRIPRINEELGKNPDLEHFKAVLKRQAFELLRDVWHLLQFLFFLSLLVVTFVKLPDFLSAFRPAKGLRKARDCALAVVSELVVGILELLLLLTAWKTYRLVVSAVIFGLLSPAAMLALASPGSSERLRFVVASLCWLALLIAGYWATSIQIVVAACCLLVLAFTGICLKQVPGWFRPRGGKDWWGSVVRCTFPNALALGSIIIDAAVLARVGKNKQGLFETGTPDGDILAHTGLAIVVVTILLETLPMVSDETEQSTIASDSTWRMATMIGKDALLLPMVLALAPYAAENLLYRILILFLMLIASLSTIIWDVDVPYTLLLDVRSVGLSVGGRKLLMMFAVLAGVEGHSEAFLVATGLLAAWIALWVPCGCSAPWAEVLRLGVPVGAVAAAISNPPTVWIAWATTFALALCTAVTFMWRRRRLLASSDVPLAFQHLVDIQQTLQLWDSSPLPPLHPSADVKSAAQLVLKLEDGIPIERLCPSFFSERRLWRLRLVDAPNYGAVLEHIGRLKDMVSVPVTRVLVRQVLSCVNIAKVRKLQCPLANEIVQFAVPDINFKMPLPPKGWEFGKLDLVELQAQARSTAQRIPSLIQTKARRPSTFGSRTFHPDFDGMLAANFE